MLISLDQIKINNKKTTKTKFTDRNSGTNSVAFLGQKNKSDNISGFSRAAFIASALAAIGGLTLLAFKVQKINSTRINNIADDSYKTLLVQGLKDKFNMDIKKEQLQSVMGADEFRETIKKYSPEDFSLGNPLSKDSKEFFKNVTEGKFRVTLHNHSTFSDGLMSPQNFIDMASQYADKVAKKLSQSDTRPPFIIALTDHDDVDGCKEIIKIIAQNPEKYKNLKFVAGAELIVRKGNTHFDLTALGVNPFDENLNKYLNNLKMNRTNSAQKFISQANELTGQNITLEQLEKTGYNGKNILGNKSGIVYLVDVMGAYRKNSDKKYSESIRNLFNKNRVSYQDTLEVDFVIDAVKNSKAVLALTHPAKSFKEFNEAWYEGLLKDLKNKGVSGIEANHQYTFEHYRDIKDLDKTNSFSREFAQKNDIFLSGGTDSHFTNIFGHHHKLNDGTLNEFLS